MIDRIFLSKEYSAKDLDIMTPVNVSIVEFIFVKN